jgi:hypothetical protein
MFYLVSTGTDAAAFRSSHNTTSDGPWTYEDAWDTAVENANDLARDGYTITEIDNGFRAVLTEDGETTDYVLLLVEEDL